MSRGSNSLKDFPQLVAGIVGETGLEASMLELEITESVVMKDEAWAEQALAQLKALGVMLAIDDFGTGYSELRPFAPFAVDRPKIDRLFMTSLIDSGDDRAIAAAIIAMSRSMRISVTAEGSRASRSCCSRRSTTATKRGIPFSRTLPAPDAHKPRAGRP
jgi:EAL domain-containing protein (putative c-di-GMP-specific phosphodiesterase class I)